MAWLSSIFLLFLITTILTLPACAVHPHRPAPNSNRVLAEILKVHFEGNKTFSHKALCKAIASRPRPLLTPWKRGESFNPPTLDADLQRLKKYYFDRGFLEATASVKKVAEDPENNSVRITIDVTEGPSTHVADISLVNIPEELPTQAKILESLAIQPKKRITKAAFNKSKAQLIQIMQNVGYARAGVLPHTEVDRGSHQASITFILQPGKRTYLGKIMIKGEKKVAKRAILRQLEISSGDLYNPINLGKSSDNIYQMDMFTSVTAQVINLNDDDTHLHIEFDIRERKPHRLEFSVGASNIKGFRFRIAWTHRNLFGNAENITFSGRADLHEQAMEAKFHLPYFLYRGMRFTHSIFVRNEQEINIDPLHLLGSFNTAADYRPGHDLFTAGGVYRVDRQMTSYLSAAIGLDLHYNDFRNISQASQDAEDNLLFIQFALLRYDTSDSVLNPAHGIVLQGRLEHSTSMLLSDENFVKFLFEARHYLPIWSQIVFATRLRVGSIQPYGGNNSVPPNLRFFAGGTGSIRGFNLSQVGPINADAEPEGGNSLIEGSAEFRFPVVGDLWGAVFLDYGNVYRQSFTYDLDKLRYAIGFGIRYLTVIGPIRIDVSFLPKRERDENICKLEFSIGQAF